MSSWTKIIHVCVSFQMKYSFEPSQLVFLRILSDRARQNITYHCRKSVAWYDKETDDYSHSIKIMGDNGIEFHASSSNKFRPTIIKDDCHVSTIRPLLFGWLAGWLVRCYVYYLAGWLFVRWLFDWLAGRLVGWFVSWLVD